jgi:integrase
MLSQMVMQAARRAGITRLPVRAHVLRHSVATFAVAAGADVRAVAALLNHSNLQTAQRDIHNWSERVDGTREDVRRLLRQDINQGNGTLRTVAQPREKQAECPGSGHQ